MGKMDIDPSFRADFEKVGRIWLRNAISAIDLDVLDRIAAIPSKAGQRLYPMPSLTGVLAPTSSLMQAICKIEPAAKPVRIVAFNKSQNMNWGVPWHQDRVISTAAKSDVAGYKNWTEKSGTWHCEPPQSVLEKMLFVRVHLDKSDHSNGAMEIAVGSHNAGMVKSDHAASVARKYPIEVCKAERGDVLILKMLTLHSSKPAVNTSGRRVLRIDFSPVDLPDPLAWLKLDHKR